CLPLLGSGPHSLHIRPVVFPSVEQLTLIHDYSVVSRLTPCQSLRHACCQARKDTIMTNPESMFFRID
ncbi:MAG: hypothetical protein L0K67_07885, partial [Brevibacterium sp.]|nr:hypothetical protein [Brevibacterium sp.]